MKFRKMLDVTLEESMCYLALLEDMIGIVKNRLIKVAILEWYVREISSNSKGQ